MFILKRRFGMPTRHLHFANKNNASQERDDVISPFAVIVTVSS